ncbi:murein biosynthesis integral membrane protein MurJ [Methylocapsa sp. S129]|uniref:murein biosynthesis integral membrane protein MurJ n=1 Tax=Methylocapsa sp. S129 TaxID=1641869 RepID=UPI00131D455A|nr:murein biosynthesis integral membrane protein MurJ [Methylocapsa sp. S129]
MVRGLLSVGGFTLLSRVTGFGRDLMLAAILGAGALNDAFVVAFRLPNQFRAIFGEGAFNTAYVPSYTRVLATKGDSQAKHFSSQIFTLLLASQLILLALAFAFTPWFVELMAPGFQADPDKFALAVRMTRITFPYLMFITLVTLHSGTLNAHGRFAIAAFAPVLLNVAIIGFLSVAFLFPNAGEAASWGVVVSGAAQLALVAGAARRLGLLEKLAWPRLSLDVRQFFRRLAPAIIGSAGVQIAIFADTIIASLLPTGVVSSINYAERLYQLPIGVIGVAAGTVLLPEMSRRLAGGDVGGASHAQNRTMAITLALSAPFCVAFLLIPEIITRGAFLRGAFSAQAAANSAAVLAAYGLGLMPIVLIRSAVASFQARGDTATPMFVSLGAIAVNVALKMMLYKTYGAVGLALATAAGAWVNLGGLLLLALRRGWMRPDIALAEVCAAAFCASGLLAFAIELCEPRAFAYAQSLAHLRNETQLVVLGAIGGFVYAAVLIASLKTLGVRFRRSKV